MATISAGEANRVCRLAPSGNVLGRPLRPWWTPLGISAPRDLGRARESRQFRRAEVATDTPEEHIPAMFPAVPFGPGIPRRRGGGANLAA